MAKAPRRVAQYLRMSTERQTYSLEAQATANQAYADREGLSITRTYEDAGISGLTLNARPGLKRLLADVLAGACDFEAVLVYDISRWGRFQDPDQGAHYEFLCRDAGIEVIYTAEPFKNDNSVGSAILKHLKRVMAAEFSRELSSKVIRAQRGLHAKGYWQGGAPGYGLRRVSVAPGGEVITLMEPGQQKAFRGYRTRLVPGPACEVETVRRIYSLFLTGGLRMVSIAHLLNEEGVPAEGALTWTRQRVRNILTNEKYAGVLVGGKSEGSLLGIRHRRPRADWVRTSHGLEPLVSRDRFDLVQAQLRKPRDRQPTNEQLLAELRVVLADHGRLSAAVIDRHPRAHCAEIIKRRFGGLLVAYELVGYAPSRRQRAACATARSRPPGRGRKPRLTDEEAWTRLEAHFAARGRISSNTIDIDPMLPSADWLRARFGSMETIYRRLGYQPSERQMFHIELSRPGADRYRRPR